MGGGDVVESAVTEDVLALIRPHFSKVKTAGTYDKVYNDECMFSFDTPFSPGGLFVSLSNMQGFGEDYLGLAVERGAGSLYLHQRWKRVPKATAAEESNAMDTSSDTGAAKAEPTLLALGVDGGFRTDEQKYDVIKTHRLVALKPGSTEGFSVAYPDQALPTIICQAADAIIEHQGAVQQTEVNQWVADQELVVSKYADQLEHVDTGRKISADPKTWVCEDSGKTENLWLNLSTGYVGSGRRNWDGSGGTGAALKHYEDTGRKYPLCVKLGTITPQGADVYSYAPEEDNLVKDPKLAEHLAWWGIDIMKLEKTDKTMAELEVELNESYDFNKITEAGAKLRPLSGPGYTGIKNLGNSCYMNSCLQVLCALPEVVQRYGTGDITTAIFKTAPEDVVSDFPAQMSKVASSLLSGKYSLAKPTPPPAEKAEDVAEGKGKVKEGDDEADMEVLVAPRMFKHLVGHGHPEFSSGEQQDAAQYMQHLLEFMRRSERSNAVRLGGGAEAPATPSMFQFKMVDRLQCLQSNTVKYMSQAADNVLSLQIPVEAAVNKTEVEAYKERVKKRQKCQPEDTGASTASATKEEDEEEVKPVVPLSACLSKLAGEETLPDYRSPATGKEGAATKRTRMHNFPRYLLVQLRRYYISADWQQKKLDVEVDMPLTLDLEFLRSSGLQADEVPMPEERAEAAQDAAGSGNASQGASSGGVVPDEELVAQLVAMGFQENGCKRAAVAVNNSSAEMAMNWVLEHMGDADFNDPLPSPAAASTSSGGPAAAAIAVDPAALVMLTSLGFTEKQAEAALKATGGDATRGADWLFSHTDDLDAAVAEQLEPKTAAGGGGGDGAADVQDKMDDGPGRYTMVGFISHVGKNTGCGHYVAHIRKDGRWAIFDDRKVAESEHPPLRLGYLYLFRRDDSPAAL